VGAIVHLNDLGPNGFDDYADALLAAAEAALSVHPEPLEELSITFVSDETIADFNHKYLRRTGPTDVISFCLGERPVVGDVYISAETAVANARRFGIPVREELLRLVIHGTLHVLGHDHPEDDSREQSAMFELQESLLDRLLKDLPQG
jgi:probable rRNA maturation factor